MSISGQWARAPSVFYVVQVVKKLTQKISVRPCSFNTGLYVYKKMCRNVGIDADSKVLDQTAHKRSLIKDLAVRLQKEWIQESISVQSKVAHQIDWLQSPVTIFFLIICLIIH